MENNKETEEVMHRLSAVVSNSTDAITVQRLDGTILDWNKGAELIYGWKAIEVIGNNVVCIIPEDKRAEISQMTRKLVKGKASLSFETKRITKDGRLLDIWLTLGALVDESGVVYAISTIERDVTDRKRVEAALEQKNIALRELLEHVEIEKKMIKEQVHANVENLLLPILKKIKIKSGDDKYLELLEHNLRDMTSSFGMKITDVHLRLSPREIEICNMIRSGFTSKEIAKALDITYKTAERHRNNIRKKLGIVKKDINLVTFLQSQIIFVR